MRSSLRTRGGAVVLAFAAVALSACGYLGIDFLPADGADADASPGDGATDGTSDGPTNADGSSVDASADAGRCTGSNCPGVIYVATIGDDQNPGTAEMPMKTITAALTLTKSDPMKRKQLYVAAGSYKENVNLVEGTTIVGGFECSAQPCSWAWDLKNLSKIVAQRSEGVLGDHTITRATVLDALAIIGFVDPAPANTTTTSAVTLIGASPTIQRCTILGAAGAYDSFGIHFSGTASPSDVNGALIIDNISIHGSMAGRTSAGIVVDTANANTVKALIARNDVRGGTGYGSFGIRATGSFDLTIRENRIFSNAVSGNMGEHESWGINLGLGGKGAVERNRINIDPASVSTIATCDQTNWCGGVRLIGCDVSVESNAIRGAKGPNSAAVMLVRTSSGKPDMPVNGNTLDAEGSNGTGYISAALVVNAEDPGPVVVGRIRNNIMVSGNGLRHFGVYEFQAQTHEVHPEVLDNNLFLSAPGDNANNAAYAYWNASTATYIGSDGINTNSLVSPFSHNNVVGTPLFAMTATTGYPHLLPTSPGIDQGTTSNNPPNLDIDNEPRPRGAGMDIGADEVK